MKAVDFISVAVSVLFPASVERAEYSSLSSVRGKRQPRVTEANFKFDVENELRLPRPGSIAQRDVWFGSEQTT